MPLIKIKHVVSCTSEDKVHKAENLLNLETYRKWKCATPGEKQISVVLQFEKASHIYSVDIGNEGSAFVEVLVGHSSDSSKNFQVMLVASSFMSPLEGRQGTNTNRVRMFGPEKLSQTLVNEKWDCVKIVCTQPFNKTMQYGLSFVKFLSPPEATNESEPEYNSKTMNNSLLGAFKLKSEDDAESDLSVGSWFAKRKDNNDPDPITGPSTIRGASSLASVVLSSVKNQPEVLTKDEETTLWKKKQNEQTLFSTSLKKGKESPAPPTSSVNFSTPARDQKKRKSSEPAEAKSVKKAKGTKKEKPINTLMENVVFVLSGFQNPFRSELRDKALKMGAKYKADWDNTCTHLVCAFINTPKYNQVHSKGGRIVAKEWITDTYKEKKHLSWRKYVLGSYSGESSTEVESDEEVVLNKPSPSRYSTTSNSPGAHVANSCSGDEEIEERKEITPSLKSEESVSCTGSKNDEDAANLSFVKSEDCVDQDVTDEENSDDYYEASTSIDSEESENDTEDELRRVTHCSEDKNLPSSFDDPLEKKHFLSDVSLPELPDFFKNKHFFLYGEFSPLSRRLLTRCIISYFGTLHDYMNDKVKYVVTSSKWNEDFDEALNDNENLVFVKPDWIFKCDKMGKTVPYQPYVVAPDV